MNNYHGSNFGGTHLVHLDSVTRTLDAIEITHRVCFSQSRLLLAHWLIYIDTGSWSLVGLIVD